MSDEASDVTKALAAFGAPAIRYHNFGHAPVRPSSIVLPRRVGPAAPSATAYMVKQAEPATVPGPVLRTAPPLAAPAPPRMREPDPAPPPLFPHTPAAAPPRPLAEWAVPIVPPAVAPSRLPPLVLPPLLQPSGMQPPAIPAAAPPAVMSQPAPPSEAGPLADLEPAIVPTAVGAQMAPLPTPMWARPRAAPLSQAGAAPPGSVALRSLPEIFEFLAQSACPGK